ncbi:unnamed protein product, partial [Ilex paraguariensis]
MLSGTTSQQGNIYPRRIRSGKVDPSPRVDKSEIIEVWGNLGHYAPGRNALNHNTASGRDTSPSHWKWQNEPFTDVGQKWNRRSMGQPQ